MSDSTADRPGTREVILIVEDESSVLHFVTMALKLKGFEVLSAISGEMALDVAERFEGTISLLLTDVMMPGMGGFELASMFRERYPVVPIVYMSGYTGDEAILVGVRRADVDFIAKPFTVRGLTEKIREALGKADG